MSLIIPSIERTCAEVLHCPHCQGSFQIADGVVVCMNGHDFPLASAGYLNLLQQPVSDICNEKSLTANRTVAEQGFFAVLEAALVKTILSITNHKSELVILDAGCGEGSLLSGVLLSLRWEGINVKAIGIDNTREAIRHAANLEQEVGWIVADIAQLPVQNDSVDIILNTICPANYSEFNRVLKPGGWLIKTIPNRGHLSELRPMSIHEDPGNENLQSTFEAHMNLSFSKRISETRCVDVTDKMLLFDMSLVDTQPADYEISAAIDRCSIDFTLLVGQKY
ncbi:MAG: methyltransferase domain-containing protein [Chitinophagaceae bacterium]|nr:MAG: methyltransferase domain-containing protein [Chitinophagaceae bacterium]